MGNYSFQGIDCSRLFDRSVKPISFQDNPNDHIPKFGSIIYTIWNNADEWIYLGIGGLGQSPGTPLPQKKSSQSNTTAQIWAKKWRSVLYLCSRLLCGP